MVEGNVLESPRTPDFRSFGDAYRELGMAMKILQRLEGENDRNKVEMREVEKELMCIIKRVEGVLRSLENYERGKKECCSFIVLGLQLKGARFSPMSV